MSIPSLSARKIFEASEPFEADSYILVTAGTFQKRPFIAGDSRKAMLLESLDFNAFKWHWRLIAFVILDNHYHLVLQMPGKDSSRLGHIVQSAHSFAAYHWRRDDPSIRSRIWWNFWDSPIKTRQSLIGHIVFLHENPRHHSMTATPETYAFSSYADYSKSGMESLADWQRSNPSERLDIVDAF